LDCQRSLDWSGIGHWCKTIVMVVMRELKASAHALENRTLMAKTSALIGLGYLVGAGQASLQHAAVPPGGIVQKLATDLSVLVSAKEALLSLVVPGCPLPQKRTLPKPPPPIVQQVLVWV